MKRTLLLFRQILLMLTLPACSAALGAGTDTGSTTSKAGTVSTPLSVNYDGEDLNSNPNLENAFHITLEGDSISFEGTAAAVDGSTITITSAGTYLISGTLNDGQIVVNTMAPETVRLILNGVNISNSTGAPIYIFSAKKAILTLADSTENRVTDGASYIFANAGNSEPNAAIFSRADLTINGNGSLTVNASYNDGISSDDDLKITGGRITVNAPNDAIQGRNYIAIRDGTIHVNAGGDGLQSTNNVDATKGFIVIDGGTLNLTSAMDGIQAETRLTINHGNINILSGGGSAMSYKPENSAKGLKAGVEITIAGGTTSIDSADDAIHSDNSITIDGGETTVASGDDGIHSDSTFTMNSGNLVITRAYEGIEGAIITINDGNIRLKAEEDGVNASGGANSSSPGNAHLYINGGTLFVDAAGDGIDVNGSMDMAGGTVIVNGPEDNGNAPLDYNDSFHLTGGYLIAVGSSGMAQAPSTSSTQYSILYNYDATQAQGTLIHIQTEDGAEILTFMPARSYQSLVFSSAALENGATYVIYSGGSSSGTSSDGLYSDGTYTPGSQVASLTISGMVTAAGAAGSSPRP